MRAPAASTNDVPADIQSVFSKPMYKAGMWGLRVTDGSRVIVDYNPTHQFYIGSVRKVFTVGALLNTVGASHTYDTPVYRTGTMSGKTLQGNLVLVASGDLTMGGRRNADGTIAFTPWDHNEANSLGNAILTKPDPLAGYKQLAKAVKAAGIDRVSGDVVIDDRLFPPFNFRDEFNVRPIFVNDDLVDMSVMPAKVAGPQSDFSYRPHSAALAIENKLVAGATGSASTMKVDPFEPKCIGSAGCGAALTGSIPAGFVPPLTNTPPLVQVVRIVQPANYARTVFIEALKAAGVTVDAAPVAENPVAKLPAKGSYPAASRVALLTGTTYAQDGKYVMKVSYNIGADTSLMLFGVARGAHTYAEALASEEQQLASKYGIPKSDYHFIDGSGGGDTSATNATVTKMLEALAKSPERKAFLDTFPILAKDGTLATVVDFKKDATLAGAAGNVFAKTGTWLDEGPDGKPMLKGQAFGGYVTSKSGKHLTYELVINNIPIAGIDDIVKVFQDEGTISAMLWRDN